VAASWPTPGPARPCPARPCRRPGRPANLGGMRRPWPRPGKPPSGSRSHGRGHAVSQRIAA
jgi:hypothetical protein